MKFVGICTERGVYYAIGHYEIDPHDFLDCNSEDELIRSVKDYAICDAEYDIGSDIHLDTIEWNTTVPEDFIREWKKLKGFNND